MENAKEGDIASQLNDVEPKAVDADGHDTGKDLVNDKISIKSPTCDRFSIRGYVATIRTLDRNTCWPFPQHLLQTRLKEASNMALPPLEIPIYRWWNCESCLRDIITSAESPIEKEYLTDSDASMQACDGNFDRGCPMLLAPSNVDIHEKQKENMLYGTEIVESSKVDLNSGDAVGSFAYETDREKKDEAVTDCRGEYGRTESFVPMELENDKSEITDLKEKKSGIPHCVPNSKNSDETINIVGSDEKLECPEMSQMVVETTAFMQVTKTKDKLGLRKNKLEEFQIPCQVPNTWEYFSRNKNVFKEISEKMKGKEVEEANSPILGSKNSTDANKRTIISNDPVCISYAENVELGQQVVVEGKDDKTIFKLVEPLTVPTIGFRIPNENASHISSDAGNNVPCLNDNGRSCPEHMNINKTPEVKKCTELSTSQFSLEKENVLLSELPGKLMASESRSKRKPQKKRLIADIIASKPSADEMDQNICMTENNEKSPRPKEDAVKKPSKPTSDTNGVSEVNIDAEINNVIIKKQRPEKLKVRKKQPSIGIESLQAFSTFVEKNSSTSSSSRAVTNALQMPKGTSLFVLASKDKSPQCNLLNPEHGQTGEKLSGMEDEIPMDIVELMAKNQHDRGLSDPKFFHECHNLQKDRRLKMKETDLSQVNKHVEGGTGLKQNTATPKSKAQPKQTGKSSQQATLRNHCQNDLPVDYGQIDVSQSVRDNLFISDKEGTTSGSCKGDLAMLQSTRCFNPRGKYSSDFVTPVLDETISARNLAVPVDGTKSHVSITHCDHYGTFSRNKMVADSKQLQGVSTYCGHMPMQNLRRGGTSALSNFTGSGVPRVQNKSDSYFGCNGYSHQNLTRTDSPQNLTSESSDFGNSGKRFDILSGRHKGNGIPNLSVRTDGSSGSLYFNGRSNSVSLQQVNAQARQPSGKKRCFPATPVLRRMGQSVSVPAKCGNKESIVTDNGHSINFSNIPQASSQKHVNCFHSLERSQRDTLSSTERVFKGSEAIQDSMCMNEQIMNSIKPIPPVPKFRSSGHYASNGHSGIFTPSSTVPGNADVALESSLLRTKSPFQGALLSGKKMKKGLQCTNDYNGNLKSFSTAPAARQSPKVVKGLSSTKGLRSYRPTPTALHLKRNHGPAPGINLESRHHCFESPLVLESNPHQNITKVAEKPKSLKLSKGDEGSAFCGKNASNVEICTLNQNPAEINIDGEEDVYSFGYDHFTLSHRDLAHNERKGEMTIPQGPKRRRTLKRKQMQEFLSKKDGYVGDPAKINLDNLNSLRQELTSLKKVVGNTT